MKYLTFSYDDGFIEDRELVRLFNKYNIKGTFNINTGLYKWEEARHIQKEEQLILYKGHEIAVHTLLHKHLEELNKEEITKEIKDDKDNIFNYFGVNPVGMAYPFGTYNDEVIKIARELGIKYSRTVISTHDFSVCKYPMELTATCHHNDPKLMDYAREFIKLDGSKNDYVFYVWGHSYEFDEKNTKLNFSEFEEFLKLIANRQDIKYLTNKDVLKELNII